MNIFTIHQKRFKDTMEQIYVGNLEIYVHVWGKIGKLITHLFRSRAHSQIYLPHIVRKGELLRMIESVKEKHIKEETKQMVKY